MTPPPKPFCWTWVTEDGRMYTHGGNPEQEPHPSYDPIALFTAAQLEEARREGMEEAAKIADNYDLTGQQTSTTSEGGRWANKTARNIAEDIRAAAEKS